MVRGILTESAVTVATWECPTPPCSCAQQMRARPSSTCVQSAGMELSCLPKKLQAGKDFLKCLKFTY